MQPEPHIGESAELYAVGALDAAELAAVDAHVAVCADCLRRLGEAEETVLALERGHVPPASRARVQNVLAFRRTVPGWWLAAAAAAAAFVLGFVFPRPGTQPDIAALAMIQSHFSHAQFVGAGPQAKAIYARDRSWFYVIVVGHPRYDVYGIRAGRAFRLGALTPRKTTSDLFTRTASPFERLELRGAAGTVEAATIR